MIVQRGDMDTNACIVGGLVGAAVGYSNIPPYLSGAVLNYMGERRTVKVPGKPKDQPDDRWLYPALSAIPLIFKLYEDAPTKLEYAP